jgi:hypothetical protein
MAQPDTLRATQLYIKIGNGASPEVFLHPCIINTNRGIQFQSSGQDIAIPDCDDPEALAWTDHEKMELSATITAAGILDLDSIDTWDAWFRSPDAKNIQVWLGTRGHWTGAYKLTDWNATGSGRGAKAEATFTMKSHGVIGAYVNAS